MCGFLVFFVYKCYLRILVLFLFVFLLFVFCVILNLIFLVWWFDMSIVCWKILRSFNCIYFGNLIYLYIFKLCVDKWFWYEFFLIGIYVWIFFEDLKNMEKMKKKWFVIFFKEFCFKVILEFGKKKIILIINISIIEVIKV